MIIQALIDVWTATVYLILESHFLLSRLLIALNKWEGSVRSLPFLFFTPGLTLFYHFDQCPALEDDVFIQSRRRDDSHPAI